MKSFVVVLLVSLLVAYVNCLTASPSPAPRIFTNPSGSGTGELVLNLDLKLSGASPGAGLQSSLGAEIAMLMGVDATQITVLTISRTEQATVLACSGDFVGFANSLNNRDPRFDNTLLQGAVCNYIFFGVECLNPLEGLESIYSDGLQYTPGSRNSQINYSLFPFVEKPPPPPYTPFEYPTSKYISTGRPLRIQIDDDEYLLIDVNESPLIPINMVLISVFLLVAALLF